MRRLLLLLMLALTAVRAHAQPPAAPVQLLVKGGAGNAPAPTIVTWDGERVTAEAVPLPHPVSVVAPASVPGELLVTFYYNRANHHLARVSFDGDVLQTYTHHDSSDMDTLPIFNHAAMSADGRIAVSAANVDGERGGVLFLVTADGTLQRLTAGYAPAWSEDGRWLAYWHYLETQHGLVDNPTPTPQIGVLDVSRRPLHAYTVSSALQGACGNPGWHPADGTLWYTCGAFDFARNALYVTTLATAATASYPANGHCYRWSADGERLLWLEPFADGREGYTVQIQRWPGGERESFVVSDTLVPGLSLYVNELANLCMEWLPTA